MKISRWISVNLQNQKISSFLKKRNFKKMMKFFKNDEK